MKEIGGYIEMEKYSYPMLYEKSIHLNSGRSCLSYLIHAYKIKSILLPYYLCDSIINQCIKENIDIKFYHINEFFEPIGLDNINSNEWLYVVNYYGQLSKKKIRNLQTLSNNQIIVDNAQAYFEEPLDGINTFYTCRKFFGVSDGAILFTNKLLNRDLIQDTSCHRMNFLLGRYEQDASNFYQDYKLNNELFSNEPIKQMSKITENILHSIDYDEVKSRRTKNYLYLYNNLRNINHLNLKIIQGAFSYPLFINNAQKVREKLIKNKVYIPLLWPNVLNSSADISLEYNFAMNILPIPCDQRYNCSDMEYICKLIRDFI